MFLGLTPIEPLTGCISMRLNCSCAVIEFKMDVYTGDGFKYTAIIYLVKATTT